MGGAAGFNRYGYVGGNPVNYTDPTGHNPLAFALIGASLFATGSAVHYSATHPGGSFDQAEYLNTVWRWTKRGGFFGAAFSAGIAGGTVFGAEFGVGASSLFNASTTSGLASVLLTSIAQGGYGGNITQIEDTFLSGFYTVFALGAGSAGVAWAYSIPRTARLTRAFVSGSIGASYGYTVNNQRTSNEVGINFAASFVFGIFSPSIGSTSRTLGYRLLGLHAPSVANPYTIAGAGTPLVDIVAGGVGHTIAALAITGSKPSALKLYGRKLTELWLSIGQP